MILLIASTFVIVPVLWMFSTSVKTMEEMFSLPIKWIPETISWDAYQRIWTDYPFGRYILNSFIVVSGATLISLFVSSLAGYGASRFRFLGRTAFLTFLLITQMFPSIMLLIPYFQLMKTFGLINTYAGLIFAYISFTIPLASWLMLGYFNSIPKELDDAASIDGASRWRIFWQIVMPLALPGLAATAVYAFIVGWNEYIFALVLTTDDKMKTIPIGIGELIGQYRIAWNDMMAVSLVVSVPLTILFLFLQRFLVSSLTAGAVKQ
ncbi:MAG: carbohydrate ABC transporter permease [Deinococcota bacterium]